MGQIFSRWIKVEQFIKGMVIQPVTNESFYMTKVYNHAIFI